MRNPTCRDSEIARTEYRRSRYGDRSDRMWEGRESEFPPTEEGGEGRDSEIARTEYKGCCAGV